MGRKRIICLLVGFIMGLLLCGCTQEKGPKLNGVSLSKYKIVGETEDYGTKLAVEELSKGIKELTDGIEPKCKYGAKLGNKVIYIANSPSDVGTYSIEANGNTITLSGPGVNGRRLAVRELLSMLDNEENVTVKSVKKAMFQLPQAAKKIAKGKLSIGFIGDSITTEAGVNCDPWPIFLMKELEKTYPDTTFETLNEAMHGRTTVWGAENIGELLLESGYHDLVFIALGTNDVHEEVTGKQTKESYISMIHQIYAKNPDAEIMFVMLGRDYELAGIEGQESGEISDFMTQMLAVSDEYDIPLVDPMSALYDACVEYAGKEKAMDTGWKHYIVDYAHPFEQGQELYGKVVWEYMKEALKEGSMPLKGKRILFVGDSITRASDDHGWAGRVQDKYGAITTKAGVDGAAISDARLLNRVIMQLEEHKNEKYDYVILHGGVNDAWEYAPVGTVSDSFDQKEFDVSTFAGGLEELICYAKEHFSFAKIGYIVNYSRPTASVYFLQDMSAYFLEAKKICEKWGVPYLDLYFGTTEVDGKQVSYSSDLLLTDTDTYFVEEGDVHLSAEGYDVISPYIGEWIATMK